MHLLRTALLLQLVCTSWAFQSVGWMSLSKETARFGVSNTRKWSMDVERPNIQSDRRLTAQITSFLQKYKTENRYTTPSWSQSVESARNSHGMPWKKSINPAYTRDGLFYMPFWEWQMSFMSTHLTNLKAIPALSQTGTDMSYKESKDGTMRIHTTCFQSDEYKLIRLTVLDAGPKTQVFTSLWYPDPKYNMPVLGTDLLQFNEAKHLCVVDFQPIQESESAHAQSYEEHLKPIRDQFPSLQGSMTKRFYDETQFFSSQMLLARDQEGQDSETMVFNDLMPAWQQYVQTHVELVQSTVPKAEDIPAVVSRQKAYDEYSAVRDPAHGLLAKAFGPEWADDYVYDILFPLSTRPTTSDESSE